jgi:hypothetical protein
MMINPAFHRFRTVVNGYNLKIRNMFHASTTGRDKGKARLVLQIERIIKNELVLRNDEGPWNTN